MQLRKKLATHKMVEITVNLNLPTCKWLTPDYKSTIANSKSIC